MTRFSGVPINTARAIGQRHGANRVVVLAISDDGQTSVTTWGQTKALCGKLRQWSELYSERTMLQIDSKTREQRQ